MCVCGGGTLWLSLAVSDWEHRGAFCRIVKWCDSVWPRLPATVVLACSYWVLAEDRCIQLLHGGPELKYLLQEGMSMKGSLLSKTSGSIYIPHLHVELCVLCCMTSGHLLCGEVVVKCSRAGIWSGVDETPTILRGFLNPLNHTKFPGMLYCPTVGCFEQSLMGMEERGAKSKVNYDGPAS